MVVWGAGEEWSPGFVDGSDPVRLVRSVRFALASG